MSTEALIAEYGPLAILLGAGIEGETLVLTGGILAYRHLISLPAVMVSAAIGSFLADQIFFSIGRHFRHHPRVQRMMARPRAQKAFLALERHPDAFILSIRFLYGLRTISPIAVGASEISRSKYIALNGLAAAFWACLFTMIGYGLSSGLQPALHRMRSIAPMLILAIAIVGLSWGVSRLCWRSYHRSQAGKDGA